MSGRRAAIGLGIGAFAIASLVAELSVRLLRPEWRPTAGVPFFRPDDRLGWAHREAWNGTFQVAQRETRVAISSQGLRDDVYPPHPVPGARRVVLLGDSFGWGFGVDKEESFEALLEARFPGLEVVNLSVPGYGTDQQLLALEAKGLGFHPELVLLLFHPNDLLNNTWPRQYGYAKPVYRIRNGDLVLENVPVRRSLLQRLARGSAILNQVWSRLAEPTQDLHASPELAWDVTERLFLTMRDVSVRGGARFAVATFPWVDAATNLLLERVRATIDRAGIVRLELAVGTTPDLIEPATEHWTPAGHRAVAAALAPGLEKVLDGLGQNPPR